MRDNDRFRENSCMREKNQSLLERLKQYGDSDFYPFHMPGHKRREIDDDFFDGFPNPYSIDITEIDGFDNLHHAEGILRESMEEAADIYGADKTYYLVNGSTCGLLAAICGCTDWNGKILLARNCHKAAYHALLLNGLQPEYLYPEFVKEYGINGVIDPEKVRIALEENKSSNGAKITAVLVVSPTYEGVVSDISKISGYCHEYGIPLIVDEAHGAHLPFAKKNGGFPQSALECGADVVIQSLHKTLPSFTQTAILHVKGDLADREKIERYLGMFQSSSPSYLFMAAIERCIRYMDGPGRDKMWEYEKRMKAFFEATAALRVLKIPDHQALQALGAYDWDMSKIIISADHAKDLNGEQLGEILRNKYHLEMEMCAPGYVIAMTSLMDTADGLLRLQKAVLEIDQSLSGDDSVNSIKKPDTELPRADAKMTPSEAFQKKKMKTALRESEGKISTEFVYLYPPGIPILAPGERITGKILKQIFWYEESGFEVQGLSDMSLSTILTVADE